MDREVHYLAKVTWLAKTEPEGQTGSWVSSTSRRVKMCLQYRGFSELKSTHTLKNIFARAVQQNTMR